jgi:chromosome segregation ATPase
MKSPSKMNNPELRVALEQAKSDIIICGRDWKSRCDKLRGERDGWKDLASNLKRGMKSRLNECTKWSKRFTELEDTYNYTEIEIISLKNDIAKRDKIIQELKAEKSTFIYDNISIGEIKTRDKIIQELTDKLTEMEKTINMRDLKILQLITKIEELEPKIYTIPDQPDYSDNALEVAQDRIETLEEQLRNVTTELDMRESESYTIEMARDRIRELEKKYDFANRTGDTLLDNIKIYKKNQKVLVSKIEDQEHVIAELMIKGDKK